MINGDGFDRVQMLLLFLTGAAASFFVARHGNPDTAFDEGPSLWCIVAIPQHLITWLMVLRYRHSHRTHGKTDSRSEAGAGATGLPSTPRRQSERLRERRGSS